MITFVSHCTNAIGSANPLLSTSRPSPHHNIVVHSTTTKQPIVVLLQKKKGHLQPLHPPHLPPPPPPPHEIKPKVNYIPPFSFSSIFHPHQFPAKDKGRKILDEFLILNLTSNFQNHDPVHVRGKVNLTRVEIKQFHPISR